MRSAAPARSASPTWKRPASGAGDESWVNQSAAEELRVGLAAVQAERDAGVARAEQAAPAQKLDHVRRLRGGAG